MSWDKTPVTTAISLREAPPSYGCSPSEEAHQAIVIDTLPQKINLISCESMIHISDIKLIRTDTTLDLSQKAEK
ncbi:hypothetical protein PHAVU_011G146400, partial [Phaseolus vulgaris]